MTVVTPQQYREQTGDVTHFWTEIEQWLTVAQGLVEDALRRFLESEERTEQLVVHRADCGAVAVYPHAYPVTAITGDGWTLEFGGRRARLGAGWPYDMLIEPYTYRSDRRTLDVTYTGGYTVATLPATLRRAIIDVAKAVSTSSVRRNPMLVGASSVTQGDTAISYFDRDLPGGMDDLEDLVPGIGQRLRGWINRL